jgi:Glycine rich protein
MSTRLRRIAMGLATAGVATALFQSSAFAADTVTFNFTGAAQQFTVPARVTELTVDAFGAQGGQSAGDDPASGGLGGEAIATIAVSPGEVLVLMVGGRGAAGAPTPAAGGFNGGGAGGTAVGTPGFGGGGGGGASDVRQGGTSLADRVVVAGGGGGGGAEGSTCTGGGGGGMTGDTTAGSCAVLAGGGGTQSAGGAAGAGTEGTAGVLGIGGAGEDDIGTVASSGGGGGGGLFGGGGGGGGGGGSGFTPTATGMTNGVRSGDGLVMITYKVNPAPPNPTPPPAGEDPRCERLREKLKRQRNHLAKATKARKRSFIRHNIGQTRTRLTALGCTTS